MKGIKENLAIAGASAVVAIGAFWGAEEVGGKHMDNLLKCDAQTPALSSQAREECRDLAGSDRSEVLEILGFLAAFGTALSGVRAYQNAEQ